MGYSFSTVHTTLCQYQPRVLAVPRYPPSRVQQASTVLQYPCSFGLNALGTWRPDIVSDTRHMNSCLQPPCHRPAERRDVGILGKIVKNWGSLVLVRLASVITNSKKDWSVPAGQSDKWIRESQSALGPGPHPVNILGLASGLDRGCNSKLLWAG